MNLGGGVWVIIFYSFDLWVDRGGWVLDWVFLVGWALGIEMGNERWARV